MAMAEVERKKDIIRSQMVKIIDTINVWDMLKYMRQAKAFSRSDEENIKQEDKNYGSLRAAEEFIARLQRKGSKAIAVFTEAITKYYPDELQDVIQNLKEAGPETQSEAGERVRDEPTINGEDGQTSVIQQQPIQLHVQAHNVNLQIGAGNTIVKTSPVQQTDPHDEYDDPYEDDGHYDSLPVEETDQNDLGDDVENRLRDNVNEEYGPNIELTVPVNAENFNIDDKEGPDDLESVDTKPKCVMEATGDNSDKIVNNNQQQQYAMAAGYTSDTEMNDKEQCQPTSGINDFKLPDCDLKTGVKTSGNRIDPDMTELKEYIDSRDDASLMTQIKTNSSKTEESVPNETVMSSPCLSDFSLKSAEVSHYKDLRRPELIIRTPVVNAKPNVPAREQSDQSVEISGFSDGDTMNTENCPDSTDDDITKSGTEAEDELETSSQTDAAIKKICDPPLLHPNTDINIMPPAENGNVSENIPRDITDDIHNDIAENIQTTIPDRHDAVIAGSSQEAAAHVAPIPVELIQACNTDTVMEDGDQDEEAEIHLFYEEGPEPVSCKAGVEQVNEVVQNNSSSYTLITKTVAVAAVTLAVVIAFVKYKNTN